MPIPSISAGSQLAPWKAEMNGSASAITFLYIEGGWMLTLCRSEQRAAGVGTGGGHRRKRAAESAQVRAARGRNRRRRSSGPGAGTALRQGKSGEDVPMKVKGRLP
jgi:hypothetical protein